MPAGDLFDTLYALAVEDHGSTWAPRAETRGAVDTWLEELGVSLASKPGDQNGPNPGRPGIIASHVVLDSWGTTASAAQGAAAMMELAGRAKRKG